MRSTFRNPSRHAITTPNLPVHPASAPPFPFFGGPCCSRFIADTSFRAGHVLKKRPTSDELEGSADAECDQLRAP